MATEEEIKRYYKELYNTKDVPIKYEDFIKESKKSMD